MKMAPEEQIIQSRCIEAEMICYYSFSKNCHIWFTDVRGPKIAACAIFLQKVFR